MKLKTVLKYAKPRYLRDSRIGYCNLCARPTLFLLVDTPEKVRNHALCIWCTSSSRNRHIVKCVLEAFSGQGVQRLSDFSRHPAIALYDTSSQGILRRGVPAGATLTFSEYFDDTPIGGYKDGILCQDLRKTTFPDASFDLMISEDVFEHIPGYRDAFVDVYRILKPGGYHIFSIPYFFAQKTRDLFEWRDGKPALLEPIEYHGDPVRGMIPCFTYFGYDLMDLLHEIGFEVEIDISQFKDDNKLGTFNSFTFVTRKPEKI